MALWKFIVPVFILLGIIAVGTLSYHSMEKWRYLDSAYFTVATITTIGYGDFTPQTDAVLSKL